MGRRALLYTGFNFTAVLALCLYGLLPRASTALCRTFAETVGEPCPAVGANPPPSASGDCRFYPVYHSIYLCLELSRDIIVELAGANYPQSACIMENLLQCYKIESSTISSNLNLKKTKDDRSILTLQASPVI
jgi:hypothetical protein